ncbi:MAG: L-2-amino-thiazoline-4-carboxylic acid hydrolase [Desulfovibrionaceae bacterium]
MAMDMLEMRRVEASALAEMHRTVREMQGPDAAMMVLRRTLERLAFAAGRQFAQTAPKGGPSLKHFATIVERWKGSGALDVANLKLTRTELTFDVVRCAYAEAYRDMDLPPELVRTLSCIRDAPFAKGYCDRLELVRPNTLAAGADHCDFRFVWGAAQK